MNKKVYNKLNYICLKYFLQRDINIKYCIIYTGHNKRLSRIVYSMKL